MTVIKVHTTPPSPKLEAQLNQCHSCAILPYTKRYVVAHLFGLLPCLFLLAVFLEDKGNTTGVNPTTSKSTNKNSATSVQRDDNNHFTLPGSWKKDPSLAAIQANEAKACGPGIPRVYPFGLSFHGCCSDQYEKGITPPTSVFWPEQFSNTDFSTTFLHANQDQTSTIHTFLEILRGRSMLFVGDSLTLVIYAGIEMQMNVHSILFEEVYRKQGSSESHIYVPNYNATLKLLYFHDLEKPEGGSEDRIFYLQETTLVKYVGQSDIVMANIGLHSAHNTTHQGIQMKRIQDVVEQEQQQRRSKSHDLCLLWRRTTPQHFPTTSGSGRYEERWKNWTNNEQIQREVGCQPIPNPWIHPSNGPMDVVRHQSSMTIPTVVDFTSILQDAHSYHSPVLKDCTHYCYTPLLWSPMLYLMTEAIRQAC